MATTQHTQHVVKSEADWFSDAYTADAAALIAAGLCTPAQLLPQEGRRLGRAMFFPDGKPVPKGVSGRLWVMPGFKEVTALGLGRFRVRITVGVDEQKIRSARPKPMAVHDEDVIERELAEEATKKLEHKWLERCETWEGTKAQLQAAGIGRGAVFPGEPGGPRTLRTVDLDGYLVKVTPHYSNAADEPHPGYRYIGHSYYTPRSTSRVRNVVAFAPGVLKSELLNHDDCYTGPADALIAAGLVRQDQLPGQPGRGKTRCSYHADGTPASGGSGKARNEPGYFTVLRAGSNMFQIELRASEMVRAERSAEEKEREELEKAADLEAKRARMTARGIAPKRDWGKELSMLEALRDLFQSKIRQLRAERIETRKSASDVKRRGLVNLAREDQSLQSFLSRVQTWGPASDAKG